jgi:hypothetical protein
MKNKIEFSDRLPPAKKITPELLRKNPFLANLFRQRAKEVREILKEKKKWELPLD